MAMAEQTSPRADRALVIIEAAVAVAVVSAVIGTSYGPASTVGFLLMGSALAATVVFLFRMVGALRDPALDLPPVQPDDQRLALEAEKTILLQGIKELEGDSGTGKVDREDYQQLRRAAEARAVDIIRVLNDSDKKWLEEAEALVARRTGRATPRALPKSDKLSGSQPSAPALAARPALRAIEPAHPGLFATGTTILIASDGGRVHCQTCQAESDADARFCTGCGRRREAV